MGEVAGGELDALAAVADRHPPTLRTHDERGRRVDEVVRHPAYEAMERIAFERFGLAALSHREGVLGWPGRAPHVVKYALSYLFSQAEFGLLCPVSVTDSTSRMLRRFADDGAEGRLPAAADRHRLRHPLAGCAVDDREDRRLRRRRLDDGGAPRPRRRRGGSGATSGSAPSPTPASALTLARPEGAPAGHAGPRPVPGAQGPARRHPQRVDAQPAQGQARLPLDGDGRGRRSPAPSATRSATSAAASRR